jgi:DNA-binding IclR family transcriptional regulator
MNMPERAEKPLPNMNTHPKDKRDRRFASTLAKGLDILRAFSPGDGSLGNRELARRTGMPPSTVARMTFTLTKLGFLQKLHSDDSYRLGPAVMALGYTARAGLSYLPIAEPMMQELADKIGMLVALAMRDGDAVMLTRCWRPRNTPSIWLSEGHRLPLDQSSPGRAIMAAGKPGADEDAMVIRDREALQSHGFVSSVGHWNPNINACSVPFWPDPSQEPVAFLCGANIDLLSQSLLEKTTGPLLLKYVRKLERSLGQSNVMLA